jgi:hypothetical protein
MVLRSFSLSPRPPCHSWDQDACAHGRRRKAGFMDLDLSGANAAAGRSPSNAPPSLFPQPRPPTRGTSSCAHGHADAARSLCMHPNASTYDAHRTRTSTTFNPSSTAASSHSAPNMPLSLWQFGHFLEQTSCAPPHLTHV